MIIVESRVRRSWPLHGIRLVRGLNEFPSLPKEVRKAFERLAGFQLVKMLEETSAAPVTEEVTESVAVAEEPLVQDAPPPAPPPSEDADDDEADDLDDETDELDSVESPPVEQPKAAEPPVPSTPTEPTKDTKEAGKPPSRPASPKPPKPSQGSSSRRR